MRDNKHQELDHDDDQNVQFKINSPSFHSKMMTANLVGSLLVGLMYLYQSNNDNIDMHNHTSTFVFEIIETAIIAILLANAGSHYYATFVPPKKEEEYVIKVTDEDENTEVASRVKKSLSKYINYQKDIDDLAKVILEEVKGEEVEVHDVFQDNQKPLEWDKFLPWQDSVMQPANPFSLATSISTASINCPKAPAFSPNGGAKVSDDEESDIDSPKVNQLKSRRSLNKGSRQSIRAPVGVKPRSSLMNQRSSVADIPQLPTAHVNYYENPIKKDEVDGHASWISFVLYEETKIIEKLAKLDPNDDELTLALRKRSTMINISTTTNTKKNFTKKERNILEEHVIEFNNKIYEKRRSSSVIQKITSPMPKSLIEWMKQFKTWNFDSFLLNELTSNNPLSFFMQYAFQAYSLDDKLDIDRVKYRAFFYEIQELYHKDNHYHNAIHGSDVAQAVFYFLEKGGGNSICQLDLLETASCLIAAAVHDVDHPGVNNYYLVNTKSPLAVLYNDKSVLENCHVACAFNLMRDERFDIFGSLTEGSKKTARNIMIQTVLATDNAMHFQHLNHYKSRRDAADFEPHGKDKVDLLSLILHSADLSNPTRPLDYSKKWSMRVLDEFFLQGDKERELGLAISNLWDRYTSNVAETQTGFFNFFVKPFFSEITQVFPSMAFVISNVEFNSEYWKTQSKRCQKELEELQKSRSD